MNERSSGGSSEEGSAEQSGPAEFPGGGGAAENERRPVTGAGVSKFVSRLRSDS